MKDIGWAIIGTGGIAGRFAGSLTRSPDARLVAVASRDPARGRAFANTQAAPDARICADPAEAATAPGVDAVYVATPHPLHHAAARAAIAAGKAVLVEKPMTLNAVQAEDLVAAARARGTFLMEAMWTRCLPATRRARQWIAEGRIGAPHLVTTSFGFAGPTDPRSRLLDPVLGGGALLDVGVYTLAWTVMVFGTAPVSVTGAAHLGSTGVDERSAAVLGFPGGGIGLMSCAVRTATEHTARIDGAKGRITVPDFWQATTARLEPASGAPEEWSEAPLTDGFDHELAEVCRCLRAGLPESPLMPLADTLAVARAMDALRRSWGLRYPDER